MGRRARNRFTSRFAIVGLLLCGLGSSVRAQTTQTPLPIRVVVVTMFEVGSDTGDTPGEFQNWVEKFQPQIVDFPQGYRHLRYNPDKHVLGVVTGVGTARSASSIMALGMDPRFDLRKAYWVVAGIAGVDPKRASLGSAAWAEWVVDADLGHEIDAREIPPDWPSGQIPLNRKRPYEMPPAKNNGGAVYHLDPALVHWAFGLTRATVLADSEPLKKLRAKYVGYPEAQKPPLVLLGDDLSGENF